MKRTPILVSTVLALVLAACGSDQTDPTPTPTEAPTIEPTSTPLPTPEATPSPTADETAAPTDDGGPTGELSDLLPDRVAGLDRIELPPGMEQMFAGALGQSGVDAEEADFVWAQWGDAGELMVTGLRAPGMTQADLDALARALSMSQTGGEVEVDSAPTTIGGKSVLRVTPTAGGVEQTVYIYIAGDAMFTVVAQEENLAAELLSQLP